MQYLTHAQRQVLDFLKQNGPTFNGTLGARVGLSWRSAVFRNLERAKLIEGHPYQITDAGRAALLEAE
jgi:Mn-dependent DtxR family transcriptional regulator